MSCIVIYETLKKFRTFFPAVKDGTSEVYIDCHVLSSDHDHIEHRNMQVQKRVEVDLARSLREF